MDSTTYNTSCSDMPTDQTKLLDFRQLKEYYNFRRKFKADKKDETKQGKYIQNEYYLIEKNWLNRWKEKVRYNEFSALNISRDANDNDYNTFKKIIFNNKKDVYLYPLDNSNIYLGSGEINPFAEFVIINKACQTIFALSKQNNLADNKERSIPIKYSKDKIILYFGNNSLYICFRNESTKTDEEIIVIFEGEKNKQEIMMDIEKGDIKDWLKRVGFDIETREELNITEKECKIKIINKALKIKNMIKTTRSNTTMNLVNNLPGQLKDELQTKVELIFKETTKKMIEQNQNNPNSLYDSRVKPKSQVAQCNNNNAQQHQQFTFPNSNISQQNGNNINNNQFNNMISFNQNGLNNLNIANNQNMNQMMQINMVNNQNMNQIMQMNNQFMNPIFFLNNGNNQNMNPMIQMNMFNNQNMNQMMQMNNINNFSNNLSQSNPNIPFQNNIAQNGNPNNPFNPNNLYQTANISKSYNFFTFGISYPHQAGLMNVGQSCYMNATIECLSNIKSLSNYLLERYNTYDIDSQPLCVSFSSLLYDLLHTKEKYIEPSLFKKIIGRLNPLFEGNHAADAKDLIFFIIETLHKELLPPSQNDNVAQIDYNQQEMISQDDQQMLNAFLNEYSMKQTVVSKIFYGINRSKMYCFGCQKVKFSYQIFNILIFPLKKVKEYKRKKVGFFGSFSSLDLNLYDAFECEQEEEKLEGENMIYCNRCQKLSPGNTKQDIYGMPNILIIVLNRGKNNADFNEEFRFDPTLDFSNTNIIINQNSFKKFYLCGIITHLGGSGSDGHFIAYSRNNPNDNFMCYNDASATLVSIKDAMEARISSNDIEKKTPYILLYHYMN